MRHIQYGLARLAPVAGRTLAVMLCSAWMESIPGAAAAAETVTVKGFGQSAIESALRSCRDGHTVFFPEGTYIVYKTIELPVSRCTLTGVRAKSVLKSIGGDYIFHGTHGRGTGDTFSNLVFQGGGLSFEWGSSI